MPRPTLTVAPWSVGEPCVDVDTLGVTETLFALSNGYLGMRGTLEDGDPCVQPGTYLSGVYEEHPLAYPEEGYGNPENGEAMVGVAEGTTIRLTVDGVPLDVREMWPTVHSRELDLAAGILARRVEWTTPTGTPMQLRTERLVSLADRSASAVRYVVTAPTAAARVVLRSEMLVNDEFSEVEADDPRVAAAIAKPFVAVERAVGEVGGTLVHRTASSRILVAACVEHDVTGAEHRGTEVTDDHIVTTFVADLAAGESVEVVKYLGHAWAGDDTTHTGVSDRARASVASSRDRGWAGLAAAQREILDAFWADADVEVEGDPALQQALRYDLFQLFCASACISDAPIGAKGLTGGGYSGHTFWDIEGFVLPALTLLRPAAAARLLLWRASGLETARERARVIDVKGAAFPWRTISGREVSGYWPASTAAVHLGADIARAYDHYVNVTGESLDSVDGFDVVVETARVWASIAHTDARGCHFFGVTGPDEYTGVVDDNVFTNLMARRHLRVAADACEQAWTRAQDLGVDRDEVATWRRVSDDIHIPWDADLQVHPMNENFTTYREWRFEDKTEQYPVQEHNHYAKFYRRQVCKQADLVQAIWWCRDEFTDEQVAHDLAYYEARTVRDSSLSAAVQGVVCAQAGHVDLALRYLREAAFMDLRDLQGDTKSGLHMAAMAGAWFALVAGLGGMREDHDVLELVPRLPTGVTRTAYRLRWRGSILTVETTSEGTTLSVRDGHEAVEVVVDGRRVTVSPGQPCTVELRRFEPLLDEPTQPAGRAPRD